MILLLMSLIILALWRNVDYYIKINSEIKVISLEGKHFSIDLPKID